MISPVSQRTQQKCNGYAGVALVNKITTACVFISSRTGLRYRAYVRAPSASKKRQWVMVLSDLIGDVFRTLWSHKLRTFLTMFGIAWGIVSIVLMVAAGEGLRKGQEEQSKTLGKDIMIVFHGRTSLQAGGARAGRVVHWDDTDVQAVQSEGPDCQY